MLRSCTRHARRDASPSAAIIGSQSIKPTESGGSRGYDAGKKIGGRKCNALVNADGWALFVEPQAADAQDRDFGGALLQVSRSLFPYIKKVWADDGYNHDRFTQANNITVGIVSKIAGRAASSPCHGDRSSSASSSGSTEIACWQKT